MSHEPSDSPGTLTHRFASSRATPVFAVGRRPSPAPGGLHQLPEWSAPSTPADWLEGAAAYGVTSSGPLPLRLVSITKCVDGVNGPIQPGPARALAYALSTAATFAGVKFGIQLPDPGGVSTYWFGQPHDGIHQA